MSALTIVYAQMEVGNERNAEIAAYLKNAYPDAPTTIKKNVEISEDVYYQGDTIDEINGKVVGFSIGTWRRSEAICIATENWETTYYKTYVLLYDGTGGAKAGSTDTIVWD